MVRHLKLCGLATAPGLFFGDMSPGPTPTGVQGTQLLGDVFCAVRRMCLEQGIPIQPLAAKAWVQVQFTEMATIPDPAPGRNEDVSQGWGAGSLHPQQGLKVEPGFETG